jgi:ubiquinone biosynthesis protein
MQRLKKSRQKMSKAETAEKPESGSRLREIIGIILKNELTKGVSPQKLRATLEDLGPTFIKIGQLLSNRSDILPEEYCIEFSNLRSDVEPMPYDEVIRVIESSYGTAWTDVFSKVEENCLGAASIAQVHRAQLITGEEVVVKVQREGVYDLMKRDINLLHKAVKLMPPIRLKGVLNLDMILDELWVVAQEEMNFLQEANNMEEFSRLNEDILYIGVPKLYRNYTTGRVLVMEYIEGFDIDDKDGLLENGYDLNEIGTKLVDNYVKQFMEDGFFHADPHPGNIVIREGKIIWIDMGMMGRLTNRDREQICYAIEGIAKKDTSQVMDAVMTLGEFSEKPSKVTLYRDLDELLMRYASMDLGEIDIAEFIKALMNIMKTNNMTMPHGLTLLARGLAQLEGVLVDLCPDLSILQIAANRMTEDALTPENIKKRLKKSGEDLIRAGEDFVSLPSLLAKILREYGKGQSRIKIDLRSSEQMTLLLHHLVRNMVIGVCEAALLISASIICTTDMWPKIFGIPALGALGYVAALLIAIFFCLRYFIRKRR